MLLLQDREYLELSSLCKRQRWKKVGENPGAASDCKQHENRHDVQGLRVDTCESSTAQGYSLCSWSLQANLEHPWRITMGKQIHFEDVDLNVSKIINMVICPAIWVLPGAETYPHAAAKETQGNPDEEVGCHWSEWEKRSQVQRGHHDLQSLSPRMSQRKKKTSHFLIP